MNSGEITFMVEYMDLHVPEKVAKGEAGSNGTNGKDDAAK